MVAGGGVEGMGAGTNARGEATILAGEIGVDAGVEDGVFLFPGEIGAGGAHVSGASGGGGMGVETGPGGEISPVAGDMEVEADVGGTTGTEELVDALDDMGEGNTTISSPVPCPASFSASRFATRSTISCFSQNANGCTDPIAETVLR